MVSDGYIMWLSLIDIGSFMKVKVTQSCLTLCYPMDYSSWNSPGQNTGVGSLPFSRESSQPRDRTQVFCIAGGFFTSWASREALKCLLYNIDPKYCHIYTSVNSVDCYYSGLKQLHTLALTHMDVRKQFAY